MTNLTQNDLDALRRYDTPTICNAVELFNVRPRSSGYMDRRVSACFPDLPPVVGFAATATFRCAAAPRQAPAYPQTELQVEAFASLPGPALVVIQDLDDPAAGAVFGEVMCTTYRAFGGVGLITNGAGRDLDQVRALDFPVFTNGAICSHGYSHLPSVNVPVHVGGLTVFPGDLLHADRSGITTIPLEIASEVPGVCAEVAAAEAQVLAYLKSGSVTVRGLEEARQAVRQAFARAGQRVRRS